MGKKKIKIVGEETALEKKPKVKTIKKAKPTAEKTEKEKRAGKKPSTKKITKEVSQKAELETEKEEKKTGKKKIRVRGKKYQAAKEKIKKDQTYSLAEAVKLAKETSISNFVGTLEAHINVKQVGELGDVSLPYLKEEKKKVAIADDQVVAKIKSGKIDFEILLASPKMMAKIVPFARILGPKGLMPNPKNGTLVDDPEKAIAKFTKGGFKIKTEKKAPVVHLKLGKLDQPDKELIANVETVIKTIGAINIEKFFLKASMGPVIKAKIN